jgi:hypothetical protein
MPARISRQLPALMAIAVGAALRLSQYIQRLNIALFYLRPYLIRERDERERKELVKKIKSEDGPNHSSPSSNPSS